MTKQMFDYGEVVICPSGEYGEIYRAKWNGHEWYYDILINGRIHRNKPQDELILPDINQKTFFK